MRQSTRRPGASDCVSRPEQQYVLTVEDDGGRRRPARPRRRAARHAGTSRFAPKDLADSAPTRPAGPACGTHSRHADQALIWRTPQAVRARRIADDHAIVRRAIVRCCKARIALRSSPTRQQRPTPITCTRTRPPTSSSSTCRSRRWPGRGHRASGNGASPRAHPRLHDPPRLAAYACRRSRPARAASSPGASRPGAAAHRGRVIAGRITLGRTSTADSPPSPGRRALGDQRSEPTPNRSPAHAAGEKKSVVESQHVPHQRHHHSRPPLSVQRQLRRRLRWNWCA